jgi:hypothetical protein
VGWQQNRDTHKKIFPATIGRQLLKWKLHTSGNNPSPNGALETKSPSPSHQNNQRTFSVPLCTVRKSKITLHPGVLKQQQSVSTTARGHPKV